MTTELAVVVASGTIALLSTIITTVGLAKMNKEKKKYVPTGGHSKRLSICENIHQTTNDRIKRIESVQDKINDTVQRIDKDMVRILTKFSSDAFTALSTLAQTAHLIQKDYESTRKKITGEKVIYDDDVE